MGRRVLNERKMAVITCVNNDQLYDEAVLYLQHLKIPTGMSIELVGVRDARCMTEGYQKAMELTDARYKIYMHQDCFVINPMLFCAIMDIFLKDSSVGLLGLIGAKDLEWENPVWWHSREQYGAIVNRHADEQVCLDQYNTCDAEYEAMEALDGVFLATQYDLPWRTDLFRDWHFYDIAQSREFINAGYQIVLPRYTEPWLVHACGRRQPDEAYRRNMEIFKTNYQW